MVSFLRAHKRVITLFGCLWRLLAQPQLERGGPFLFPVLLRHDRIPLISAIKKHPEFTLVRQDCSTTVDVVGYALAACRFCKRILASRAVSLTSGFGSAAHRLSS